MHLKLTILFLSVALCACYRKSLDDSSLKAEVLKYKTSECYPDGADGEDRNRPRGKNERSRQTLGFDYGRNYNPDGYGNQEDSEYHPNPYLYIGERNLGFGGNFGDEMDGYISQDMRNNRRNNGGSNQNRYKYSRQRSMRSFSQNDDCISQCVFNNMDIMEEDGTPSETAMLKWTQDKIKNDRKRITALKDIRKCFDSLSNSDKEDGCEFSRYLSECLKLNLDDDK